jgi:hypothetical protein
MVRKAGFGVIAVVSGMACRLVPGFALPLFLFGFFINLSGIVLIGSRRYRVPGKRPRTQNVV